MVLAAEDRLLVALATTRTRKCLLEDFGNNARDVSRMYVF